MMSISCSCDYPEGETTVGYPRDVTCRTPRKCSCCNDQIKSGDCMYMWSMYDYDECKTVRPLFMCEECGDMSLNMMTLGFCFNIDQPIRDQWIEYLRDYEPGTYKVLNL
ncbi:MAG: hypothetical protein GY853_05755 [PVC group bacterium]|nr:hypothetical protein [PVC group bacterium]